MKHDNYYETYTQLNDDIVTLLETAREGKLSFNKLYDLLEEKYMDLKGEQTKYITKETLSTHLKALEKNEIIHRDPQRSPGVKRNNWLSDRTKIQRKFEMYSPLKSERQVEKIDVNKLTEEQKKELAIKILLEGLYIGSSLYHREDHAEIGFIGVYDEQQDLIHPYSVTSLNGFRISDLTRTEQGSLLAPKIEEFVKILVDDKIIELSDYYEDEELYKISDNELEDFLISCFYILNGIVTRIGREIIIKGFNKQTKRQIDWYNLVVDKAEVTNKLQYLQNNRNSLKKTQEESDRACFTKDFGPDKIKPEESRKLLVYWMKKRAYEYVGSNDKRLIYNLDRLKGESPMEQKYPLIYHSMLKIINPKFLRPSIIECEEEIKKYERLIKGIASHSSN